VGSTGNKHEKQFANCEGEACSTTLQTQFWSPALQELNPFRKVQTVQSSGAHVDEEAAEMVSQRTRNGMRRSESAAIYFVSLALKIGTGKCITPVSAGALAKMRDGKGSVL
jgi:hypothetical protein